MCAKINTPCVVRITNANLCVIVAVYVSFMDIVLFESDETETEQVIYEKESLAYYTSMSQYCLKIQTVYSRRIGNHETWLLQDINTLKPWAIATELENLPTDNDFARFSHK